LVTGAPTNDSTYQAALKIILQDEAPDRQNRSERQFNKGDLVSLKLQPYVEPLLASSTRQPEALIQIFWFLLDT
jgi:hypothetical protein